MRVAKINIDETITKANDHIEIVPFYDLHIGSGVCDYNAIHDRINYVLDKENRFAILGGGLINNSIKTGVGDVYSEELSPMEQMAKIVEIFKPIAKRVIAIIPGNHERRSYKTDGIDLTQLIARELHIERVFDSCAMLDFISCGEYKKRPIVYTLYATHGEGSNGRLVGSKANSLVRRAQNIDAEIIVTGHTHTPFITRSATYRCDISHRNVQLIEQTLVNASSTLGYEEYAELMGMSPNSNAVPIIKLYTRQHKIDVTLS